MQRRAGSGVLLLVAALACGRAEAPPGAPPVVLVTLESLRSDHFGAAGGSSPVRPDVAVTPELDAFAAGATVYEDAHSVTSWTLASHASLFTGLYPSGHQTDGPRDLLDASYPTLAETLAAAGYQTAGVVSGPYLRRTHNLHQGFELWDESPSSLTNELAHDDVTNPGMERALARFLREQRDPERPFFLFAYFWDPHFDFLPPPPWDDLFVPPDAEPFDLRGFDRNPSIHAGMSEERRRFLLARYAGELRATDAALGRFLALLRELDLFDRSLVIVTADHGEEFFDHGAKGHKNNLHAETTHVPLVVKYPGQTEGRRDARLVSLVDLLPTVLEVAGVAVDFPVHGRSLLAEEDPERAILFELLALRYHRAPDGGLGSSGRRFYGVRSGAHKLLWDAPPGEPGDPGEGRLYDVEGDPGEQRDLAGREPELRDALGRAFEARMEGVREDAARYRRGGAARLSPEEVEQLRELGYLDG